jgi:hypothetical protein
MREFMGRARRKYYRLKKDDGDPALVSHYEKTLKFQQECMRLSGWLFNRDWENIEEVYTQADLRRLAADQAHSEECEALCDSIAWTIWDVYRRCEGLGQEVPFPGYFGYFLSTIEAKEKLRPAVITTNYDCLVELCLLKNPHRKRFWWYPGLESPRGAKLLRESEKGPPDGDLPLVKIHGSSNWFFLEDKCVARPPVDDEVVVPSRLQKEIRDFLPASSPTAPTAPTIIPPMLGKATLMDIIARQWREAILLLSRARKLWIIGYSFPPTDAFMPRLLAEGMQENEDLEEIVIMNREDQSRWSERVEKLFTPSVRQKVGYIGVPTVNYLQNFSDVRDSATYGLIRWF